MVEGLTLVRLKERLAALQEWRRLGGSAEALAELDRRVRHADPRLDEHRVRAPRPGEGE